MTLEQRQQIKEKIRQNLEATAHDVALLQERTKPIAPDCALGRDTREEILQMQHVDIATLHQAKIRQNKLNFALKRVDLEEYGICLECEDEIAYARMLLVPESTHCVACKTELGL